MFKIITNKKMAQQVLAWKCNCKSLEDVDLFSKSPDLYFKSKPNKSSLIGRIFTFSYAIIYAAFFVYKIIRMVLKIDVSFYENEAWTGEIPTLDLNNDHFYGGFALMNVFTGKLFIDETIYYPVATFATGIKDESGEFQWEYEDLGVEPCQLEKFGSKFRHLFVNELDNLYCLKNVNVRIQGHTTLDRYSYFYVAFYPCVNGVNGRTNCQPEDVVRMYLHTTLLTVKMQDIELTPQIYKSPTSVRSRILSAPVMENLYNNIQAYFHIISVESDNDVVGFEALSKKDKKKFFKYDVTFMVTSIMSEPNLPTQTGEAICNIQLQLTEQMITIDRTYTKLLEVLGDVGGLMEFVFSFFRLLSIFITEALYEKSLVNNLFSFDLDKKTVELKNLNKKKGNNNLNDSESIKPINSLRKQPTKITIYGNEETIRTKNILNEGGLSKEENINNEPISVVPHAPNINVNVQTRKKKIKKKKSKISSNLGRIGDEDVKSKNEFKANEIEAIKISNQNLNSEGVNSETDKKKRNIIDRLNFRKVDLYLCFLCTRKRKNMENILIDEGMRMISQNLDVLKIFINQMKVNNYMGQSKDRHTIRMSDECKRKIVDYYSYIQE